MKAKTNLDYELQIPDIRVLRKDQLEDGLLRLDMS